MASYGLLPQGLVRPRLPEIRQEIIDDLISRLRAAGINELPETRPDSVIGLAIDTFAERIAALWELVEGVYLSLYPSSATGTMLDRAVSFAGVTRLNALKATATVVLYGTPGTVVPVGTVVKNATTQTTYTTDETATIGGGNVADVTIGVRNVQPDATYLIRLAGVSRQYDTGASPTVESIIAGLASAIAVWAGTTMSISTTNSTLRVVTQGDLLVTLDVSTNLQIVQIGSPVGVTASEAIEERAAAGDLNQIVSMISGLSTVNNLRPGSAGRQAETDAELRARYQTGVFRLGAGTHEAILANLRANVAGLSFVDVQANDSDVLDSYGNVPHSIRVIADGGSNIDIGQEIFRVKGAGIDTNGAETVNVMDTEGVLHPIHFDRASPVYVWVRATITLLPASEEAFPASGYALIQQAIVDYGNSIWIGKDVVWQRLLSAAVKTSGVASVDLRVWYSTSLGASPDASWFTAQNITIAPTQVARFDLSRVTVD